jgi:hypothetical protein
MSTNVENAFSPTRFCGLSVFGLNFSCDVNESVGKSEALLLNDIQPSILFLITHMHFNNIQVFTVSPKLTSTFGLPFVL